jgi:hypothetical protein
LGKHTLPFFKLLEKPKPFVWTEEAEKAFEDPKKYLTSPLVMVASEPSDPLLLNATTTAEIIRVILNMEWDESHPSLGGPTVVGDSSQLQ